jgi:lipopolysaccharide export system ATP-binding protein
MKNSLVVNNVCKSYKGRTVVDNASLIVNSGEIVGLLGPNGAGKTTLFKLILGIEEQNSGTVTYGDSLDGLPLYKRARRGLGYLSQTISVFRDMSAKDNLQVILEAIKAKNPERKTAELLKRFGLEKVKNQKAHTLSGGECRRLEFARALCSNPEILLVDEPFAGIDPIAAMEISSAITACASAGIGILLTDHSLKKAFKICHKIYLLVNGKILEEGSPYKIKNSALAKKIYLGDTLL